MIGMQGNFNPSMMNMNMNMNNMTPIHPPDDANDQDMMTEILNISKIKEGFYIGDKISAISLDVIIQFKITHMINATGNQIMNQWESIGIAYLTLNWSETPKQILFDSKDEIANRIVEFIDGSLIGKGEGILAHSLKGQNRVCIVVLIYLMKKYKWSLNKSMEYLKSKKQDVDIPIYFFEQLKNFENRLRQRGELTRDIPWEFEGLNDPEEKLLRNTYLNGIKVAINNNITPNRGKNNLRRIMWADNNPYQKSPLELNDSTNDLFYQKDLRPITVHQSMRPKKGCIKGMSKIINNIGINLQGNLNKLNIINNAQFKSKSANNEIMSNFSKNFEEYKNNIGIPKNNNNIFSSQQNDNNWNNMNVNNVPNIPNITALRGEKNDRNALNNNYFNQNNNNMINKNNMPYNQNINLIASGKFNNQNNMNNNMSENMEKNIRNNNMNNKMNNNISNSINNINRFNQQQQQAMIQGKINNNQIDVSSSDNFLNKERNNLNSIGKGNIVDLRINNSVNIKESSYNMNSLNSLNPSNINYYNMHNSYKSDEYSNMEPAMPVKNSIKMDMNDNNGNMMFTFGKPTNQLNNNNQNNINNSTPFNNNNNQGFLNNNRNNNNNNNNIARFRNDTNNIPGYMNNNNNNNNNKNNVSPFRNDNNNSVEFMNKNKNNISPFRNDNNIGGGYLNNKNKNISPFHNNNDNSAGFMNNNRNNNNNNISPFHNNNDNSTGFMNNRQNLGMNNNYIKNKNNNTATNFYKDNKFQNMINYTPLVKDRDRPIGDNLTNNNTSNSSNNNNKNKNIFSQKNQQMTNYNPVSRFNNGRPMSGGGNNFNKNMINQNRMNNNFTSNKPLNNFNPNLIKPKDNPQAAPSLLNKNKNSGPIKIKNNNYINNNLNKKPNTPDLNHYYSTGNGFMDNNIHNRFKYNTNNNKKDIKNNTMSNGFGYPMANNYNKKIGIQRPSTAPKKEKNNFGFENNKMNRNNNQYGNNFGKPVKFNQRPSSAGGKNKNGYGYANNINKNGIGKNLNNTNMNKNKKNMGIGINKRLPSPQIYSNSNGLGFNNNQNKNKYNPAKHRMPSPVIKSNNNFMKRPPLPNSGPRIRTNKNDKFN